jgi:tRNA modification GTPase
MNSASSDHIACLTPPAVGAIASLGLRGPNAWQVIRELLRPLSGSRSELAAEPEMGRLWLGRLGDGSTDQVVVTVRATEPVPWLEVHCHGGREVIGLVEETLQRRGFQVCAWQEFERLVSGDRWRAAAALAEAQTVRTAAMLLDQYQGAFERALTSILSAWDRNDHGQVGLLLEELARYTGLGRHLTKPWQVVVAGAPNVGKSSLVNALAGYQRSIAAATPGTTRDLVSTTLAIDGWPIELVDTAGIREAAGGLEEHGIRLARQAVGSADLVLWILDASAAPVWPDYESGQRLVVINKVDLSPAWNLDQAGDAVRISARMGTALDELCQTLSKALVPSPPPVGAGVPFTAELCELVERSRRHWLAGQEKESRLALESAVCVF